MTRLGTFALGLHASTVAMVATILVVRRSDIAADLGVVGGLVAESAIFAAVALVSAVVVGRLRDVVPAGLIILLGAIVSTVGLSLMAWTIDITWFTAGGILVAAGAAPALVLTRILVTTRGVRSAARARADRLWAFISIGAATPLASDVLFDIAPSTALWTTMAISCIAAVSLVPLALLHDEDEHHDDSIRALDTPWVIRSRLLAVSAGGAIFGGGEATRHLLEGEWQRSPTQTAAVLAAGPVATAAATTLGRWYRRLDDLTGSQRADAVGLQVFVAGTAVAIGGLSFTYIGLVVSLTIAGAALGLAVGGIDAATNSVVHPSLRRTVAVRQLMDIAIGGATVSVVNAHVIGSWSDQWKIAITGVPLACAGWAIRRFADPASPANADVMAATATSVPRRVLGLDNSEVPSLKVEALDVAYGPVQVLFGVNLTVEEGQIVALLGTNGAGKTTLLRAISGLEPTIGGRVIYSGLDITSTRPTWRVGMGLHQIVGGGAIAGDLTVAENLRLFTHLVPANERSAALFEAYELFPKLGERRDQVSSTLSGGEKQMLALSKALMHRPRLLLIDEFSLGLAPTVIAELLPVVRQIADRGAAVLLVEQSVNIALSIADHAFVMEKGTIGHHGPAAELRDQPDLLRAAYLEGLHTIVADS